MKLCGKCKDPFEPKDYQLKSRSYYCRKCASTASVESARRNMERKYRNNKDYFKKHPEVLLEKQRRERKRYPEKHKARMYVQTELRARRISRGICEVCGILKTEAHHDDYLKPLEVRWLCKPHHDKLTNRAMLKAREGGNEKIINRAVRKQYPKEHKRRSRNV